MCNLIKVIENKVYDKPHKNYFALCNSTHKKAVSNRTN